MNIPKNKCKWYIEQYMPEAKRLVEGQIEVVHEHRPEMKDELDELIEEYLEHIKICKLCQDWRGNTARLARRS
jgi:aryl carrier-like protein